MDYSRIDLTGKVALVTGASRGIGAEIGRALASLGCTVVLTGRDATALDAAAGGIQRTGGTARVRRLDVRNEGQIQETFAEVVRQHGRLDILVNNAGAIVRKPVEETTTEEWDLTIDTNLRGCFWCAREAGKIMIPQGGGKIVNIASVLGVVARPTTCAYAASKAGIIQLTRTWAVEWAKHRINVNAVAPGFVETDFIEPVLQNPATLKYIMDKTPLGRLATPQDVAAATVFLVSEAASYVTGHCLYVDGGWTAE